MTLLINNATVITVDPDRHVLTDCSIVITNGKITALGPSHELENLYRDATTVIDAAGKVVRREMQSKRVKQVDWSFVDNGEQFRLKITPDGGSDIVGTATADPYNGKRGWPCGGRGRTDRVAACEIERHLRFSLHAV